MLQSARVALSNGVKPLPHESRMRWRRLDVPGREEARIQQTAEGWRLSGELEVDETEVHAQLAYVIDCDRSWRTRRATVTGSAAERAVRFVLAADGNGHWKLDGAPLPAVDGALDVDLGFTPATNLLQLRRIALREGEGKDVPVAWLNVGDGTLSLLRQRYERRTARTYWYEAPRFEYAAMLDVDDTGFPKRYPDLWEAQG